MKEIPGFNGLYFADENGDIFSKARPYTKGGKLKKFYRNRYNGVSLCVGSKKKSFKVCRLVALAFHDNKEGLPQVNHINGDRLDDRPSNLEWVTAKQNNTHAVVTRLKAARKPIISPEEANLLANASHSEKVRFAASKPCHYATVQKAILRLRGTNLY